MTIEGRSLSELLSPASLLGAVIYLLIFVTIASLLTRTLRAAVHAAIQRRGHLDRTTISFVQQLGTAAVWVVALILYAHLIPVLRAMGTALLASAGIASVVIGLAAQATLGNLIAGVAMTIYRPFALGDVLQVTAPTGTEVGTVEMISLGYTRLRATDGRLVVLPNSLAASQVTLNLSRTFQVTWPFKVEVRLSRDADLDAARAQATQVACALLGADHVDGCFVIGVGRSRARLELRCRAPDAGGRDGLRSQLLVALARELPSAAGSADRPTVR